MLLRHFVITCLTLGLVGCNGGNVLSPNTTPSGNITLTNAQTQQSIATSQTSPLGVTGGFTFNASESHFNGAFTASIVGFTNATNLACFTVAEIGSTQSYTVTPTNAAAPSTPPIPNPCASGDLEEIQISDNKGHSTVFWYTLTTTIQAT